MQTRRQEILIILKQKGEATVDELARILDLTPVTVRHHLDILRADGLVEAPAVRRRRGPGRPQYVYTLTSNAIDQFPKKYDGLINDLLDEIKSNMGEAAVQGLLDGVAKRRIEKAPALDPGLLIPERLDRLVEYMSQEGYIASWEQIDGNFFIHCSNCPYQNASIQHPELCEVDLFLLEKLAGSKLTRIKSISKGAHRCTYQIIALDTESRGPT